MAPYFGSIPVKTFTPKPQPAIFPILNINPPNAMRKARKNPRPGKILLAISCPLFSLTLTIRQIFICVPMSNRIEIRITNPKLVSSCSVNKDVCVRKPGPIAEVAIRNAAPSMAEFFFIMLPAGVILICFCCVAHLYFINSIQLFYFSHRFHRNTQKIICENPCHQ